MGGGGMVTGWGKSLFCEGGKAGTHTHHPNSTGGGRQPIFFSNVLFSSKFKYVFEIFCKIYAACTFLLKQEQVSFCGVSFAAILGEHDI